MGDRHPRAGRDAGTSRRSSSSRRACLSVLGGILGAAQGWVVGGLNAGPLVREQFQMNIELAMTAPGRFSPRSVAAVTGWCSGFYPAIKASKDPIVSQMRHD